MAEGRVTNVIRRSVSRQRFDEGWQPAAIAWSVSIECARSRGEDTLLTRKLLHHRASIKLLLSRPPYPALRSMRSWESVRPKRCWRGSDSHGRMVLEVTLPNKGGESLKSGFEKRSNGLMGMRSRSWEADGAEHRTMSDATGTPMRVPSLVPYGSWLGCRTTMGPGKRGVDGNPLLTLACDHVFGSMRPWESVPGQNLAGWAECHGRMDRGTRLRLGREERVKPGPEGSKPVSSTGGRI